MGKEGTCRDFERGICNRGDKCKYFHPEGVTPPEKLPICKDYQNKRCDRHKCKFLHITVEEQEEYNRTGVLPAHGGKAMGVSGGEPCKDFLNGICDRGNRCKFSHISQGEVDSQHFNSGPQMFGGDGMYGKRRRDDYGGGASAHMEENEMLKRKITELQGQVLELRKMNDTLYEQNTRYRNQLRGTTAGTPSTDPYSAAQTAYPAQQPVAAAVPPAMAQQPMLAGYSYGQY